MRKAAKSCVATNHLGVLCGAEGKYAVIGIPLCIKHFQVARRDMLEEPPASVVYYAGDLSTRQIKIGTTANLRERLRAVGRKRRIALLATEPGTFDLERKRHEQFAPLRLAGEWFQRDGSLMTLVNDLRAQHGILHAGGRVPDVYLR